MKKRILIIGCIASALTFAGCSRTANTSTEDTRYVDGKPTESLTKDAKRLVMSVRVGWRVTDAGAFAKSFSGDSVASAQGLLQNMISSADTQVVGLHNLSDFVSPDGSETTLNKIEKELQNVIEGKLEKNSGIAIESIRISSVSQR